jgi:hypothetical protein
MPKFSPNRRERRINRKNGTTTGAMTVAEVGGGLEEAELENAVLVLNADEQVARSERRPRERPRDARSDRLHEILAERVERGPSELCADLRMRQQDEPDREDRSSAFVNSAVGGVEQRARFGRSSTVRHASSTNWARRFSDVAPRRLSGRRANRASRAIRRVPPRRR